MACGTGREQRISYDLGGKVKYENYERKRKNISFSSKEGDTVEAKEIMDRGLYEAAVVLMDDDIREELHREYAPCTELKFLEAYMDKHYEKYGMEFIVI